jgi:hypothetical protein
MVTARIVIHFPGSQGSSHHADLQLTYAGANTTLCISVLKVSVARVLPGQSVVGVDWTASSTGDTELATGYSSALLEKGEYDRTNLATTITDKLQYAQPRFGQTFLDANNDFLRRSDNYWHTVALMTLQM